MPYDMMVSDAAGIEARLYTTIIVRAAFPDGTLPIPVALKYPVEPLVSIPVPRSDVTSRVTVAFTVRSSEPT